MADRTHIALVVVQRAREINVRRKLVGNIPVVDVSIRLIQGRIVQVGYLELSYRIIL